VVERAVDGLCLARAALWIHGELGEDAELESRLASRCVRRRPKEWIAAAEARPRAALARLGLVDIVSAGAGEDLEAFWWAPLGLARIVATPEGDVPAKVDVRVETLE
jgi:hypothetical protein